MMSTQELRLTKAPVAETGMLIRRPVVEVFAAFVDPDITSKFWFSNGSGRLVPGARVTWEWSFYGVSTQVDVKAIDEYERILIDWDVDSAPTAVEWRFTPHGDDATFVNVVNSGFHGDADAVVAAALDSTGGFTWVLAGAKAWLEHGLALNLVPDRHPDARVDR
jgi:uncharacterized protein YndB with AHSA1/START domain